MWQRTSDPKFWDERTTLRFLRLDCTAEETIADVFYRWTHRRIGWERRALDQLSALVEIGELSDRATVEETRSFLRTRRKSLRR